MAKKKTNINFIINLQVYPFDVMVSIAQTDMQLAAHLDKYPLTEADINLVRWDSENNKARAIMFSTCASFIRLRKLPETSTEYGELAHEIFHITTFVMEKIGMDLKVMVSDEAYAYLIQYLTTKIYESIDKYY